MAQTLDAPTPIVAEESGPRRITIEEYDQIPDDAFGGARVELIEGQIYTKMGQNFPHIAALRRVARALRAVFGDGFDVSSQTPIGLGDASKPEPDVLVLRGDVGNFDHRYPDPANEIEVLVEVSDTTFVRDSEIKAALYAKYKIPEYWIVNLRDRTVEVRREPRPTGYAETRVYAEGESIPVGGGVVSVTHVLPKA